MWRSIKPVIKTIPYSNYENYLIYVYIIIWIVHGLMEEKGLFIAHLESFMCVFMITYAKERIIVYVGLFVAKKQETINFSTILRRKPLLNRRMDLKTVNLNIKIHILSVP
jgi:hypothetical protein